MKQVDERLGELGLALPQVFAPPPGVEFKFELVKVTGSVAYVSGHGPMNGSEILAVGKVDRDVSLDQARAAARVTVLSILASLEQELGSLNRVVAWHKLAGFVNASEGFDKTPAAINAASELILDLWGDAGRHARSAIGVAQLPFNWPVEIEAVVEVTT